ncbi:MAG: hypothetical protein ACJAS1_006653, partial [Oleiphilaceae bacterium]
MAVALPKIGSVILEMLNVQVFLEPSSHQSHLLSEIRLQ